LLRAKACPDGSTTYDYDSFGNLRQVTLPNRTNIDYVIDGQNRRIGKNGCILRRSAGGLRLADYSSLSRLSSTAVGPFAIKGDTLAADRPITCVRLLVEGKERLQFFRVLFVATDSFDAARQAAREFLRTNGAQLVSFDESETAIVQTADIPKEMLFPEPTSQGVMGGSAPIWVDPRMS
jgi:hypothetical protein